MKHLRARAEKAHRERKAGAGPSAEPVDAERLVHELEVHQIELEMQNEELVASRAAAALALQRFTDLYETAPVGYFTLDAGSVILQANGTGARLVSTPSEHLVGARFGSLVIEPHEGVLLAAIAEALTRGSKLSCEVTLAGTPDRPAVQLALTMSGVGRECRVVAVDVTERARIEDQLRSAQKMEAIGRLAGGIAHDFNNLLTVILSHADFAIDATPEASEVHTDLMDLKSAAERAATLTRHLLAFSRRQVLRPRIIDVNEHTRGLMRLLARLLGEAITLELQLDAAAACIDVDPVQFEQVLLNLAVNARDAMPNGGTLTLTTATSGPVGRLRSGPCVRVSLRDTGVGMDNATMSRIFEPFFTTKEKESGTGFGLATVHGIVHQCGGDIKVESEPGKGSTFSVYFPASTGVPDAIVPSSRRRRPSTRGQTILAVEDDDALRGVVRRTLEASGYTVLLASNGLEALDVCKDKGGTIELVLTDVVMPKMNGSTLASRLSTTHPRIKVMFMSGYSLEAMGVDVLDTSVHFIGKPFAAEELVRRVRAVLEN